MKSMCLKCDKYFSTTSRISHHIRDFPDHKVRILTKDINPKTGFKFSSKYRPQTSMKPNIFVGMAFGYGS